MSSVRTYSGLVYAMDDLRRAWRQRHLLEAALLIVAAVLGLLVLVVAIDNLLSLGVGGRFLGLLVVLGSGGMLILGLFVKRCLEQRRDDYFAALCEKQFPELDNRLINGLQLGRGTEPGSPQIIDAIVDERFGTALRETDRKRATGTLQDILRDDPEFLFQVDNMLVLAASRLRPTHE